MFFLRQGNDQTHEQNKRAVKVDCGTIEIISNENALLEWAPSGSYAAKMVCESTNVCPLNHHEDTKSFKKEFPSRRIKLIEAFNHFESPFSEFADPLEELMNIVSKELMSAKHSRSFRRALQIGQSQCNAFTKEKLNAVNTKPTSLYAIISKNSLTMFKCKAAATVSKKKKASFKLLKGARPAILESLH